MAGELLDLISRHFKDLSDAEKQAIRNAADGKSESAFDDNPPKAVSWRAPIYEKWGKENSIRAELIRFLCTNREVRSSIHPRGIHIRDAWIFHPEPRGKKQEERDDLELDLDSLDIPFTVYFDNCVFPGGIQIRDTRCRLFVVNICHIGEFRADRSRVDGTLSLARSKLIRPVSIREAVIEGSLLLRETTIKYPKDCQYKSCIDKNIKSPERGPYSFDIFSTKIRNNLIISGAEFVGMIRLEMASVQSFDDSDFVYNEPPTVRGFSYSILSDNRPAEERISNWLKNAAENRYKQPFDEFYRWLQFNGQQKEASIVAIARDRALSVSPSGKRWLRARAGPLHVGSYPQAAK